MPVDSLVLRVRGPAASAHRWFQKYLRDEALPAIEEGTTPDSFEQYLRETLDDLVDNGADPGDGEGPAFDIAVVMGLLGFETGFEYTGDR